MEPLIQKLGVTPDEAKLLLGGILRECNMGGTGHKDYRPSHQDNPHRDYNDHTAYTDYKEQAHHRDHDYLDNAHDEYPTHKDHHADYGR